jgi:hypothetical protein
MVVPESFKGGTMKSPKSDTYKRLQATGAASPKIGRKRLRRFVIAMASAASLVGTTVAFALTPANGGMAGGTTVTINNGMGDQTDPHVNGDLAVYTHSNGTSQIRYFDFVTTNDNAVPPVPGANDILSDVFGNLIAFTRVSGGTTAMLYDVSSNTVSEIASTPSPAQFSPVLGGHQVAFIDLNAGNGDIMVFDLLTNGPAINVSQSADSDDSPSLSPTGSAVVWERCVGANCDVLRSLNSGGTWSVPEVVSDTPWNEGNPDTDGATVVYDSNRPSATGGDIYFQPLLGGTETQLEIAGEQRNPSINNGVIAFESDPGTGSADIYLYVVATNTLLQVTNTPIINDTLNDVTVLGNGDVRVVWSANDGPGQNVYGRTFSLPTTGDTTAPTVTITTPVNGATYIKGQAVASDFLCHDESGGSGLASCTASGSAGPVINGNPIDTTSVGFHLFSVTSTDNAGNSTTATNTYKVVYNFNGFFQPIDNLPTLNIATAGSAIPVKFSLGGNQGLAIFVSGFPASSAIPCDASEPGTVIEETVNTGNSSLSYNATTAQYNYVWKTDKAWKGTCRMLIVEINDGTQHLAKFRFR